MTRYKGIKKVTEAIEPLLQAPLDARTEVEKFSDLLAAATWKVGDNHIFVYPGIRVYVKQIKKWFKLKDSNYGSASSWLEDDGLNLDYLEFVEDHYSNTLITSNPIGCIYHKDTDTYYAVTKSEGKVVQKIGDGHWSQIAGKDCPNPINIIYNKDIDKFNVVYTNFGDIKAEVYNFSDSTWSDITIASSNTALAAFNMEDEFVVLGTTPGTYWSSTDGVNYAAKLIEDFPAAVTLTNVYQAGSWLVGFRGDDQVVYFMKKNPATGNLKLEYTKTMPIGFSHSDGPKAVGNNACILVWDWDSLGRFVIYDFAKEAFYLDSSKQPIGSSYRIDNFLVDNDCVISFGIYNQTDAKINSAYYTIRIEDLLNAVENGETPNWISNFNYSQVRLPNYLCAIPAGNNNYLSFYAYRYELFHFGKSVSQYGRKVTKELAKTIEPYLSLEGGGLIRVNSLSDVTEPKMNSIYKLEAVDSILGLSVGEYVANIDSEGNITWHKVNGLEVKDDKITYIYRQDEYLSGANKRISEYDEVNDVNVKFYTQYDGEVNMLVSKGQVFNPDTSGYETLTFSGDLDSVAFRNGIGVGALGNNNYIFSSDGVTWIEKSFPDGFIANHVASFGDAILAWDNTGTAYSTTNGDDWESVEIDGNSNWNIYNSKKLLIAGVETTYMFTDNSSDTTIQISDGDGLRWDELDVGKHYNDIVANDLDDFLIYQNHGFDATTAAIFRHDDTELRETDPIMNKSTVFVFDNEFYNVSSEERKVKKLVGLSWELVEEHIGPSLYDRQCVFQNPNYIAYWDAFNDGFIVWTKDRQLWQENEHKEASVAKSIAPYIPSATKHRKGSVRMSTDEEAEAGEKTDVAINPYQLKKFVKGNKNVEIINTFSDVTTPDANLVYKKLLNEPNYPAGIYEPREYTEAGVKKYEWVPADGLHDIKNELHELEITGHDDDTILSLEVNPETSDVAIVWIKPDATVLDTDLAIYKVVGDKLVEKTVLDKPSQPSNVWFHAYPAGRDWFVEIRNTYSLSSYGIEIVSEAGVDRGSSTWGGAGIDEHNFKVSADDEYYYNDGGSNTISRTKKSDLSFKWKYNDDNSTHPKVAGFMHEGRYYHIRTNNSIYVLDLSEFDDDTDNNIKGTLLHTFTKNVVFAKAMGDNIYIAFEDQQIVTFTYDYTLNKAIIEEYLPAHQFSATADLSICDMIVNNTGLYIAYYDRDDGANRNVVFSRDGKTFENYLTDEELDEMLDGGFANKISITPIFTNELLLHGADWDADVSAVYAKGKAEYNLVQENNFDKAPDVAKEVEGYIRNATEKFAGTVKLATDTEAELGENKTSAITPYQLKKYAGCLKKSGKVINAYKTLEMTNNVQPSIYAEVASGFMPIGRFEVGKSYVNGQWNQYDILADKQNYVSLDASGYIEFVNKDGEYCSLETDYTVNVMSTLDNNTFLYNYTQNALKSIEEEIADEGYIVGGASNWKEKFYGSSPNYALEVFWTEAPSIITVENGFRRGHYYEPGLPVFDDPKTYRAAFSEDYFGICVYGKSDLLVSSTRGSSYDYIHLDKEILSCEFDDNPMPGITYFRLAITTKNSNEITLIDADGMATTNALPIPAANYHLVKVLEKGEYYLIPDTADKAYKLLGKPSEANLQVEEIEFNNPDSLGAGFTRIIPHYENERLMFFATNEATKKHAGWIFILDDKYEQGEETVQILKDYLNRYTPSYVGEHKFIENMTQDHMRILYGGHTWKYLGSTSGIYQYVRTA